MARLRRSEIARRQHRRRQLFAAGEGATGTVFTVAPTVTLVLNDGTLLDISSDVRFDAGIKVRRGRSATDTKLRAGNATMKINNRDGKYSPRNATSPLYGLIGRGTQIVIARQATRRAWMEIPEWPPEWTTGGQDAWVNLTAAGPLRRLLAPNAPVLESAIRRAFLRGLGASPVAYWPLEGGDSTTTVSYDLISGAPSSVGGIVNTIVGNAGAAQFGTGNLGPGSGLVVNISGGYNLDLNLPSGTVATGSIVLQFSTGFGTTVRSGSYVKCGIRQNPFGPNARHLAWNVFINDSGLIELQTFEANADFSLAAGPTTILSTGSENVFDGLPRQFQLTLTASGGTNVAWILTENDSIIVGAGTLTPSFAGAMNSAPFRASAFSTASSGSVALMGHVGVFTDSNVLNKYVPLTGYAGETAGTRMARLCLENGVNLVTTGDLTATMPMGPQKAEKLVDLLFDCEAADMGLLGEDRNHFGLTYRTLGSLVGQGSLLELNYAASGNVTLPLLPSDNDQRIINDSDVHLSDGSGHSRYSLTSGPMSTAAPASGGIGSYPEAPTVNVAAVANAADVAGWHVNVGTVDRQRFDQVNVNVANAYTNHGLTGLVEQMTGVDIGSGVSVYNPPVWLGYDQINLIAVGEYEVFDQIRYTIAYDTILQDPYQVGIAEDVVYGHAESDGTTVVDPHTSSETQFQGLTATGELWATTALLPGDFPFDVMISGERMTVTDITGVSNPQTWTVTRSVNGVVKAIPAGASVYLRNPFRAAP